MARYLYRTLSIICIVALLCTLCLYEAHAWGDTAHRIICEIAFKELNSQAGAEVKRLT